MGPVDLDAITQELYGLPPSEFVGTRNARAKQARADGDRELAAEIQKLAKPTTAAWLVNQLSRRYADDLEPLLDLGRDLREASAGLDGEALRTLSRRRNELISELLDIVRRIGSEQDYQLSDDVADEMRRTLEASLSDAEIADDVAAGRLTRAVEYAGFGEITGLGGPTGIVGKPTSRRPKDRPKKPAPTPAPGRKSPPEPSRPTDLNARRRQRAERDMAEAAQRLEEARTAREDAAEATRQTAAEVAHTAAEVQRLRDDVRAAEKAAKAARQTDRAAQQQLAKVERELAGLERVHERAAAKLAELDE
jgi:hypothetical protein